mmetsp:Transcript_28620/g.52282  ORF Transcript_28620/g.52282 Transcript_28620/m.52282 type:complete len:1077 (-) Transcript_28620:756-3986(-)
MSLGGRKKRSTRADEGPRASIPSDHDDRPSDDTAHSRGEDHTRGRGGRGRGRGRGGRSGRGGRGNKYDEKNATMPSIYSEINEQKACDEEARQLEKGYESSGPDETVEPAGNRKKVIKAPGAKRRNRPQKSERAAIKKQAEEEKKDSGITTETNKGPSIDDNHAVREHKKYGNPKKGKPRKDIYPPYADYDECLARYAAHDKTIIRGKLRVMPKKNGASFVSCDRGSLTMDVVIEDKFLRNRGLDGDYVFVELLPSENPSDTEASPTNENDTSTLGVTMEKLELEAMSDNGPSHDVSSESEDYEIDDVVQDERDHEDEEHLQHIEAITTKDKSDETKGNMWRDDKIQRRLWNPLVPIRKAPPCIQTVGDDAGHQAKGKVLYVIPPKSSQASELKPSDETRLGIIPSRTIVGSIHSLPGTNRNILKPNNKSLPHFMCPRNFRPNIKSEGNDTISSALYRSEYVFGSWTATDPFPPCVNVKSMGNSCNVEDETMALLAEFDVDHGDFPSAVLKDVEESVQSGRIFTKGKHKKGPRSANKSLEAEDLGWKPTPEMCQGRRDYRNERIFTIDPTTAKDLDDALHIKALPDGMVEIGVHIADVSHFIKPDTALDHEAARRATTIYLVDRTVPMLPRPLCEIACSLNENVERLAFSCVWRMNMDGTLETPNKNSKGKKNKPDVWYGKSVIKSCARLDYATAQNIIDRKIATGEKVEALDETLWPKSRQPTGGHTIDQVASDVRLMHKVAMARRALRFENGALVLNGVKLSFQLENDGCTPKKCAPYPIRDSNRLVEEYMLMANYLVAQRLITHAGGLAVLRHHPPPLDQGIQNLVAIAEESIGFHIDASTSQTLQASLNRLGRDCNDDLVMQCVTELAMLPMKPAEYIAAGEMDKESWRHFALNIPYYTHFTSPIRRYPDVMVHRLLEATIDGEDAISNFGQSQSEIHSTAEHCNDKKVASKKAQDRSDRVFLSIYLKSKPLKNTMGVVLSVGEKTFTVYVPELGVSTIVFLDEHKETFDSQSFCDNDKRRILMTPKKSGNATPVEIRVFSKLAVSCYCKEAPPINVSIMVERMWRGPSPSN